MFNDQFYPTPLELIDKMLAPFLAGIETERYGFPTKIKILKGIGSVLEPSAGKGDICDALNNTYGICKSSIYACEIEPELQFIIQKKGYKLIDQDFLEYRGEYFVNTIIMNPPFNQGVKHLLHAWNISKGGKIICLLNAETISNTFSEERKLLSNIIKKYGKCEIVKNAFSEAERKTDVDTAIVWLEKPKQKSFLDFEFSETDKSTIDFGQAVQEGGLALNDATGNIIRQYHKTLEAYVEYMKAKKKMEFFSNGILGGYKGIEGIVSGTTQSNPQESYNNFTTEFKKGVWVGLINKMGVEKYFTEQVKNKFDAQMEKQGNISISKQNIMDFVNTLMQNRKNIMKQAIVEVFDYFTKYYKENREHIEGWVNNDSWVVKGKTILPNFVKMSYGKNYEMSHWKGAYMDIDKVMCYLSGKNYDKIKTIKNAVCNIEIGDRAIHESEFFNIRVYKKGTAHLIFKDQSLLDRFNIESTRDKWGLPYKPKRKGTKTDKLEIY